MNEYYADKIATAIVNTNVLLKRIADELEKNNMQQLAQHDFHSKTVVRWDKDFMNEFIDKETK